MPKIFSNVVTQELNNKDREVKHRAVKKFTIFWKITAKDYKDYKPFQPEFERNRERNMRLGGDVFNQLPIKGINVDYEGSSSSGKEEENEAQEHERSYVALHNMLLILEDDDPSLRLACRSWL